MRILMVSDVYFPRVNGVSTSIMTFRRELEDRGHQVTLLAPDYGGEQGHDPRVVRVPSRGVPLDPEDRFMRPGALSRLGHAFQPGDFDLLHIQTPFVAHYMGIRLARRLGLPRVETYHTFFEEYLYHYVPFLPRAMMRATARRFSRRQCNEVDSLVVPSSAMLEALRRYGVHSDAEVIPTGIELGDFGDGDGMRFRDRFGIPGARPVLVYVGRVAHEKNIGFLLRMVRRLRETVPDVLLVIAGEGPAARALRREAADLGIGDNVLFVGYLARDGALQDCYSAGNAFVFASTTETQGLVLLEAMALGVPVVAIAHMGTRDVLCDGRGALVAEADETDFAAKVQRVLTEPGLAESLSRGAREYAAGWSAGALAERMIAYYERVIGARG